MRNWAGAQNGGVGRAPFRLCHRLALGIGKASSMLRYVITRLCLAVPHYLHSRGVMQHRCDAAQVRQAAQPSLCCPCPSIRISFVRCSLPRIAGAWRRQVPLPCHALPHLIFETPKPTPTVRTPVPPQSRRNHILSLHTPSPNTFHLINNTEDSATRAWQLSAICISS